jgi:hypothetical protein
MKSAFIAAIIGAAIGLSIGLPIPGALVGWFGMRIAAWLIKQADIPP